MGSSPSSQAAIARAAEQLQNSQLQKLEEEIVSFVMPVYYTKDPITNEEKEAATACWKLIVNNKAQCFLRKKAANPEQYPMLTCTEYFYDVFYKRLFDVHPSCKVLFKRPINKQGSFFVRMVSMLLGDLDDHEKWNKTIENMTQIHNKLGVKAVEWGIAGEVLLYTIVQCVGEDVFTPLVKAGWVKFYSRMLEIIVPCVVHFEMQYKEFAQKIAEKRNTARGIQEGQSLFVESTGHSSALSAAEEMRTVQLASTSAAPSSKTLDASAHTIAAEGESIR